jgi:hypothetical protein
VSVARVNGSDVASLLVIPAVPFFSTQLARLDAPPLLSGNMKFATALFAALVSTAIAGQNQNGNNNGNNDNGGLTLDKSVIMHVNGKGQAAGESDSKTSNDKYESICFWLVYRT